MYTELDPRQDIRPHQPRILTREVYYPGQLIIEQGRAGNRAYYIEKGTVEIFVREDEHEVRVAQLGAGEIFGEMALIEHAERSATVYALEETTVTVISAHDLEGKIQSITDPAMRALLHIMTERLQEANHMQVDRCRDLADFQDRIAGLVDKAENGIEASRRVKFRKDVTPLLEQLDELLAQYRTT